MIQRLVRACRRFLNFIILLKSTKTLVRMSTIKGKIFDKK
jgi:hypothetical protein